MIAAGPAGSAPAFLAHAGVARVMALLNRDGEEARVVGGAVRNHLMGLALADVDIATTALPDEVMRRAAAAGVHAVPTGFEHGTVTLVVGGTPHEVTTLREDVETDGRRAVVRFGRDFVRDALRRDFTINALSVDIYGALHDYCGGLADIAARRVRFIGDADQRITEDYLRILRFFRFSAAYGAGAPEPEGLAACIRHRDGLAQLSRERVRQETMKLLVAARAMPVVEVMAGAGLLVPVLGGPGDLACLKRLVEIEADCALAPDAVRRLAALAFDGPAAIERLRAALRLTNHEMTRLERIAEARERGMGDRELLYRLGAEGYRDAVLDRWARGGAGREAFDLPQRWQPPAFEISGKDVLALGVVRGPAVGRLLHAAEAAWIAAGMPSGIEAQRAILAAVSGGEG